MSWFQGPRLLLCSRQIHTTPACSIPSEFTKKSAPQKTTDLWIPCQWLSELNGSIWRVHGGQGGHGNVRWPWLSSLVTCFISRKKHTENWRERVLKYILLFRLPPTAESAWTPSSSPFHMILVKCLHFRLTTFYFRSAFTWKGGSLFMLLADRSMMLGASFMGADPKYLEIAQSFSSSQTQLFDWRILKIFDRSTKEPVEAFLRQIASIEVKIAYYPLLREFGTQSWRPRAT